MDIAEVDEAAEKIAQYVAENQFCDHKTSDGIARRLASGDQSLSELSKKQRAVFYKYIVGHADVKCGICGNNITADELELFDEEGMCSSCYHRVLDADRDDR